MTAPTPIPRPSLGPRRREPPLGPSGTGRYRSGVFHRARNLILPLLSLPALVALVACTPAPSTPTQSATGTVVSPSSSAASSSTASASPTASKTTGPPAKRVHVSLLENDGGQYGVGMPIIAWFNVAPTNAKAFANATVVTVNGKAVRGAWYFEHTAHTGSAMEAHYRPVAYWPARAKIDMQLPVKGLSAGRGLAYDDSLTLSIRIGASHISTVNASTLMMSVVTDGKPYGTFPVSLGASNTPTLRGTKVIMEKGLDISMRGPGYFDPHVQYTQRLTYGGEYLHSAPWNVGNLGVRSTSNGCTNLSPSVAKQLYGYLEIGDVVKFPNANGPAMQLGSGYGDWNVPWTAWVTGGAVTTR
jgi:lipoprotein-anchoring transpeptidase ErfK/SrfK